ncbi:MAG: hypothetical protein U0529_03465 [Thermoanaerobaculia bacterium]
MTFALAGPFSASALVALVGLCLVNIVVRLAYRYRFAGTLRALPALRARIRTSTDLSREDLEISEERRSRISASVAPLGRLLPPTTWIAAAAETRDDAARLVYEYVNMVVLLDVNAFLFTFALLPSRRGSVREPWEAVGDPDAVIAVAERRRSLSSWCRPSFREPGATIRISGAFHPLLAAPVPNDVVVTGRGLLVTGSNMSGKTTLPRTLGLQALLGATIATCPAEAYDGPLLVPSLAILRRGSLAEGASDDLAEVRRVLTLVRQVEGAARLFLLDEVFRGTNALERVAAGKAVLAHLARAGHVTAVSTHDVELVALLEGAYEPHHFRESVIGGDLSFDYRMRLGVSSSLDAIALHAGAAFPEPLAQDARRTASAPGRGPAGG